ncbi:Calcineurin-like phosphoesterase family protein [Azospirillaceae bacterium]
MKTAILADIHANREALDACLADIRRRGCDWVVILGDIVGYGADPAYCVETAMRLADDGAVLVRGNHDAAVAAEDALSLLGRDASAVIAWTRTVLDAAHVRFLSKLPLMVQLAGVKFVHAEPKAPSNWSYVTEEGQAAESMRAIRDRRVMCGHVHAPCVYHIDDQGVAVRFAPRQDAPVRFARTRRWLAVLPSVGQPRDGIPMSGYAEWEEKTATFTVRRVSYDATTAADKIRAAGLPERFADRLFQGR